MILFKYMTQSFMRSPVLLMVLLASPVALAQTVVGNCGPLRSDGQYGPYDARRDPDKLPLVLSTHFTPQVEMLIKGSAGYLGGDIDYTLRAIPNYHRALISMMRLGEREKQDKPSNMRYTVDCWFQRAITFAPDDAIVRMIYSTYLNSKGRVPDANAQLEIATVHAKDNPFTHYNIGLHYFDLKNYDKALAEAHKAIELGFLQIELREQLRGVGKWADPLEAPAAAASAPASPAK